MLASRPQNAKTFVHLSVLPVRNVGLYTRVTERQRDQARTKMKIHARVPSAPPARTYKPGRIFIGSTHGSMRYHAVWGLRNSDPDLFAQQFRSRRPATFAPPQCSRIIEIQSESIAIHTQRKRQSSVAGRRNEKTGGLTRFARSTAPSGTVRSPMRAD